ncbi:MAG: hypothetical protein WCA49_13280 [Candidatus Sulfotelmatobacter sp.]
MADAIGTLAEKLSEYNLFNYLVPGSVFMIALRYVAGAIPFENSVVLFLLTAYFVGMALSRIGSLVIEPVLLWTRLLVLCDFGEFVRAEKNDPKIRTLLQETNAYRTMAAVFAALLLTKGALALRPRFAYFDQIAGWTCPVVLLLLFAFSHRKMCAYIAKRVGAAKG